MKKIIVSLVIALFALPAMAEELPIKGGSITHPPVRPNPINHSVISGGMGGGLYSLLPRVASPLYINGNSVSFLGSRWGYALVEYTDGTVVKESNLSVYHTMVVNGHGTVWFVAVNDNGYEWAKLFVGTF